MQKTHTVVTKTRGVSAREFCQLLDSIALGTPSPSPYWTGVKH